ncbi:MAG: 50S ribosomal protein L24 [Pseudomonadota bacterium]
MNKVRSGDEVIVTTGRDKGRRGTVRTVRADGRLIVDGVNMVKKHTKPNPMAGVPGGIVEQEAPIQASNVKVWNSDASKGDRVGIKTLEDGKKVRVFKSNGAQIDS